MRIHQFFNPNRQQFILSDSTFLDKSSNNFRDSNCDNSSLFTNNLIFSNYNVNLGNNDSNVILDSSLCELINDQLNVPNDLIHNLNSESTDYIPIVDPPLNENNSPIIFSFCTYLQNCQGLRSKTNTFYKNTNSCSYNLIALTETWLNPSVKSEELFGLNYQIY